ncbi:hypothetical protein COR50_16150 [Chitinophaga caeni]|uniref:Uncharacterized protein n=1 Tax=Chitinophaga caeni TaxID=2029983 RepID=A0A291QXA4_9BACT|nr:hypothetical protein [Chitinophaga caeni]ATL48570.1 hypothetical protein COR50_16150 [Chitinophaga caeni]
MEYNKIRELLAKYWDCETSTGEESQLKVFFHEHQGTLPADLQEAAPMFQYFHQEASDEDQKIAELVATGPWDEVQPALKVVSRRPFYLNWMRYAAVLITALGIGYSVQQFTEKYRMDNQYAFTDTYNDPQKAFEETQKALQIVAKNLNKGTKPMENLAKFSEATEVLAPENGNK